MNKCRRYPGGPARQEGPLISSSVQSGCLTRHELERSCPSCHPAYKHRAQSQAAWEEEPPKHKEAGTDLSLTLLQGMPNQCVCLCVCVYSCVCPYGHLCVHLCVHIAVCVSVCVYLGAYMGMCVCTSVSVCVCVHLCPYGCKCMHVCASACPY